MDFAEEVMYLNKKDLIKHHLFQQFEIFKKGELIIREWTCENYYKRNCLNYCGLISIIHLLEEVYYAKKGKLNFEKNVNTNVLHIDAYECICRLFEEKTNENLFRVIEILKLLGFVSIKDTIDNVPQLQMTVADELLLGIFQCNIFKQEYCAITEKLEIQHDDYPSELVGYNTSLFLEVNHTYFQPAEELGLSVVEFPLMSKIVHEDFIECSVHGISFADNKKGYLFTEVILSDDNQYIIVRNNLGISNINDLCLIKTSIPLTMHVKSMLYCLKGYVKYSSNHFVFIKYDMDEKIFLLFNNATLRFYTPNHVYSNQQPLIEEIGIYFILFMRD